MKNVLLIFGGRSYEHDISVVTASQIMSKTKLDNIKLIPLYISKNNRFYIYLKDKFFLKDFADFNEQKTGKIFKEVVFVSGEHGKIFVKSLFGLKEYLTANIALIACHGGIGENGKLENFLENFGIVSSAGSSEGLAISMNKIMFKQFMRANKIPITKGFSINKTIYEENSEFYHSQIKFLKFPVIIKPATGGSSIGLFIAENKSELKSKLNQAFEFDENIVIENFISGAREFNVAIVGDEYSQTISEVDEPLKVHEVLSFEDKYMSGEKNSKSIKNGSMTSLLRKFPAEINKELSAKLKAYAAKVFKVLNLSGVARIDFLYDETNNKIYVCEVNSVPGSLAYYFFERGKVLINDFVLRLIEIAENKAKKVDNFNTDFVTKVLS